MTGNILGDAGHAPARLKHLVSRIPYVPHARPTCPCVLHAGGVRAAGPKRGMLLYTVVSTEQLGQLRNIKGGDHARIAALVGGAGNRSDKRGRGAILVCGMGECATSRGETTHALLLWWVKD